MAIDVKRFLYLLQCGPINHFFKLTKMFLIIGR